MNFYTEFERGQKGQNKGLYLGKILNPINNTINGLQQQRMYGIAGPPKSGKSTFTDFMFILEPYTEIILNNQNINIEWIYFSFELDRISKEFDFLTYFLYKDYGIYKINLEKEQKRKGKNYIFLDSKYLRGRLQDDEGKPIKVKDKIIDIVLKTYKEKVVPFFGEFDKKGIQTKKGLITFIEQKNNPTGLYKYLRLHAEKNGEFIFQQAGKGKRIIGYKANNPSKYTIIITDHLRKLLPERGFSKKETIDKYIEYSRELRDWCKYTFVHIIHTNRNFTDIQYLKTFKETLHPTGAAIKDTGNLSEDVDFLFTTFNPNDTQYGIEYHFGRKLKRMNGDLMYPDRRTVHLVESRHSEYPQHFELNLMKGSKNYTKFET